jgi:MHS family proline/betaine transporter-like MFS transporter
MVSLLQAYFVFAVGFLGRPLGAFIFGSIGDRLGRKKALSFSIVLMSIATTAIGFLPIYETVGILAPLLLALCRFSQGVSAGGEYNGASLFSLENYPERYHGFLGAILVSGCVLGSFCGSLAVLFVQMSPAPEFFWRIPFMVSMGVGALGIYIRRKLPDTRKFKAIKKKEDILKAPAVKAVKNDFLNFIAVVSLGGLCGSTHYFMMVFSNTYLAYFFEGHTTLITLFVQFTMILNVLFLFFFARFYNSFGYQNLLNKASLLTISLSLILIASMSFGIFYSVFIGIILVALANACASVPSHAFMLNAFRTHYRYSGASVAYSLGLCYIGGMTPYVSTALIEYTKQPQAPFYYLLLTGALCFLCLNFRKIASFFTVFQSHLRSTK